MLAPQRLKKNRLNCEAWVFSFYHRLEDIDDKTRVKKSRDQVIRRSIQGLAGAALRQMGLVNFLAVVPLKTSAMASHVKAGVGLSQALSSVHLSPGVSDDKLWVLKVVRYVCAASQYGTASDVCVFIALQYAYEWASITHAVKNIRCKYAVTIVNA